MHEHLDDARPLPGGRADPSRTAATPDRGTEIACTDLDAPGARRLPRGGRRRVAGTAAVAAAALLLLGSACGASDSASSPASSAVGAPTTGTAPSSGAFAPGLRTVDDAAFQALVDEKAAELGVPGAVVLARTPQGELVSTYGTTELGTEVAPTADTHVRIASISKAFTAAVILQLAQEGELDLTDPISTYVDGVPNGDAITLALLLEMRSGLYNYTNDPRLFAGIDAEHTRAWSPQELLDLAFSHPTNFEPGEDFEYNNTNFALLGLVAEAVTGKALGEVYQERIFTPLGMDDTLLPERTDTTLPEPYSHGYLYGSSGEALGSGDGYSDEQIAAAAAGTLLPTDYTDVNHAFAFGTGGIVSTANDLATFWKAYVGGEVLDAEHTDLLLASVKEEVPGQTMKLYGYGISELRWAGNAIDFHGGETAGFNLFAGYDPTNDLTLVVWTNLTLDIETSAATANALMLNVLDQLYATGPLAVAAASPAPGGS